MKFHKSSNLCKTHLGKILIFGYEKLLNYIPACREYSITVAIIYNVQTIQELKLNDYELLLPFYEKLLAKINEEVYFIGNVALSSQWP